MTVYVYRIVATVAVFIPFIRYVWKVTTHISPDDEDWMRRDTRTKGLLIVLIYPICFAGMFIGTCLRADTFYFGPEFMYSIIILGITIAGNVIRYLMEEDGVGWLGMLLIRIPAVFIPFGYLIYAM